MIQQKYEIKFTDINGQPVRQVVLQINDKYESFYNGQMIGVFSSFIDAANAIHWLANLAVWKPTDQQIQHPN